MMTIEQLKQLPLGQPFASGIIPNSVLKLINEYFVTTTELKWIAKMGSGHHDWAIYYGPSSYPEEIIVSHGFKLKINPAIRELVPCTTEVLDKYRY